MKYFRTIGLLIVAVIFSWTPFLPAAKTYADTIGAMTTFALPSTSPNKVVEGPDGNLWVTGSIYNPNTWSMDYITYKVSRTGSYTTYDRSAPNNLNVAVGSDKNVWITGSFYVSKVAADGSLTTYDPPSQNANPFWGLTSGPDGDVWFGMNGVQQINGQFVSVDQIGRVTSNGTFPAPFNLDNGEHTSGLAGDSANNVVWYGTYGTKVVVGKMAPDGTRTEYQLPTGKSASDVTLGPDGNIWFISGNSEIGEMTPAGAFTFYPISVPSGGRVSKITWGLDGHLWAALASVNQVVSMVPGGSTTFYSLPTGAGYADDVTAGRDGNIWAVSSTAHELIRIGTGYTDNDEDGLTLQQEQAQGTSDSNPDTDGDGISDFVESQWNPNRTASFCNSDGTQCAYPNPTQPDLYLETDWMVDPNGGSYQPSDTQLDALAAVYSRHGIAFHYDNGTYGGGNAVPYTQSLNWESTLNTPSFLSYKYGTDGIAPQFNSKYRNGIWHYAIMGYSFAESPASSGVSTAAGPDLFISYGLIKDHQSGWPSGAYSSLDTAIESTVLHELGHNLCLTNSQGTYPGQPPACVFNGVDSTSYPAYISTMNYLQQMQLVDYSSGANGSPNDHDDWSAISLSAFNRDGSEGFGASTSQHKTHDQRLHTERSVIGLRLGTLSGRDILGLLHK